MTTLSKTLAAAAAGDKSTKPERFEVIDHDRRQFLSTAAM